MYVKFLHIINGNITYSAGWNKFIDKNVDSAFLALRQVSGAERRQRVLRRAHYQVGLAIAGDVGDADAGAEVLAHLLTFQFVQHPQVVVLRVGHRVQQNLPH